MIRIFLGNVGSGKTISAVKEIVDRDSVEHSLHTFSNIITKDKGKYGVKKNILLSRDMLIKQELVRTQKDGKQIFKKKFNIDFWREAKEKYGGFNVDIDEAHTLMDARNSMSRQNKVMNDFIALIRKVCSDPKQESTLTLISQLDNRIDIISRQLCTEVRYHIMIYDKRCNKCNSFWTEHSDFPDFKKPKVCPSCGHHGITKYNHRIIVKFFANMRDFENWKYQGIDTVLVTKKFNNVSFYFPYYDTFQLTDLISEED